MRLLLLLALPLAAGAAGPRIAILGEEGFPYYMADNAGSPRLYQDLYQSIGFEADVLSVQDLASPRTFSAGAYAAYVHPYGNTFPLEAFENLVAFHRAGGCLILPSGVPFCHPVVARGAAGWSFSLAGRSGRVTDNAHSGKAALHIHNSKGRDWTGPASPRFAVKPGETFLVSGWVKLDRDIVAHTKSVLYVRLFDRQGEFMGQAGPAMPHQACDWTKIENRVVIPQAAATADVSPQLWAPDGEVVLDDLSLVREGQSANLLPNPSFEEGAGGWRDLGHDGTYQTHEHGIGTGGFLDRDTPGDLTLTDLGRRLGLDAVDWALLPRPSFVQALSPDTLPPEDEVLPLVSAGDPARGVYPAVMIRHRCPKFNGAVDVWGRSHCSAISGRALYQIVARATVEALRIKDLLSDAQASITLARVGEVLGAERASFEPVTEKRPFDTPWPHSARPAETILVCDVSMSSPQEEFELTVLQGLVNREQPRLYLIHTRYAKQDRQWLDELRLEGLKTREVSTEEARRTFADVSQGFVAYDRAIMAEIGAYHAERLNLTNIVLMLCAVHDALPLALDAGASPPPNAHILFDTRDKWQAPGEMYAWAHKTLWPRMNHHILATLYPGIFYLTDYLVQHRIFTFWFSSQRTLREQMLLEDILASTPPNTPILGWWFDWMPNVQDPTHRSADCVGEGEGVRIGSAFAKFLTPSHEAANLSVHSGMSLLGYKHKPVPNPVELDRSKVYYSFIMSDGDNLGECLMLRTRGTRWDVPEQGKVPIGWSFAPATAVLAPPVLNYYLRTATPNDLLVGGLGIAYTTPDAYATAYPDQRDAIFADYARMTADSLAPLDTDALWLIGGSRENVSRYAAAGKPLRTLFPDYGSGRKRPYDAVTYMEQEDVAVFRAVTGWGGGEPYADRLAREIRAASDGARPAFLHVFLLNWGTSLPILEEVMRGLGDDYVCVRPDELDRLFRESRR